MENKITFADKVTDKIIELLENGVCPWHAGWVRKNDIPKNWDGRTYNGCNRFLLSAFKNYFGYDHNIWLTFNKVKELGGHVKKGEEATPVCFFKPVKEKTNITRIINGQEEVSEALKMFFIIRGFNVFNVAQCEGIPEIAKEETPTTDEFVENISAEKLWDEYKDKPQLYFDGGDSAYYSLFEDAIHLPDKNKFFSADEYYSVLFHEASHSTGATKRLNRNMKNFFGSTEYSKEELIAEIASAMLCQHSGITKTLENSAAYCKGWASHLKGETKKLILQATSAAQKAFNYITNTKETNMEEAI